MVKLVGPHAVMHVSLKQRILPSPGSRWPSRLCPCYLMLVATGRCGYHRPTQGRFWGTNGSFCGAGACRQPAERSSGWSARHASQSDLFFSCGCTFRELNARVLSTSCSPLGTFVFSVDVLVLLRRLLPVLCSESVGCFLQNLPEIPSLLVENQKTQSRAGGF